MNKIRNILLILSLSSIAMCAAAQDVITTYARSKTTATLSIDWDSSNYGSIQWQKSTDSGSTWKDISGATSTSYSFTATAETWIRVVVTGDEACEPITKTYNIKVGSFTVDLIETGATTAVFEIQDLTIPKDSIAEWGFCHNYYNLSRTYKNMYREYGGDTLPDEDTFELTCTGLQPNSKNSVRVYFKTNDGTMIYGASKVVETLPGLAWHTEDWTIEKNYVCVKFEIPGFTGNVSSLSFQFGTEGNMKTYTPTVDDDGIYSVTVTALKAATDYIATVSADLDGDEQTITKTVRTWTDYSTYEVDETVTSVSHKITWDRTNRIQLSPDDIQAEYPRLLRVSSDTILLTYHGGDGTAVNTDHWVDVYLQRSTDNGATWSDAEKLMDHDYTYSNQSHGWYRFADPTFTLLDNGWILLQFIGNANPETNANCQVLICVSKDGGVTWGDPITVGRGRTWEPQIVQLPGGELELLVSSEAAWWEAGGSVYQEILCSRSTDNGETWTAFTRASYYPYMRDGMPVPILMQGNKGILFSIESVNSSNNPYFVHRDLDGEWDTSDWDGVEDDDRWIGGDPISGACAPYCMQLPTGEIVLMGHLNQTGDVWQTCRTQVCIGDNTGNNFKNRTMPFSSLSSGEGVYYASFFLADDNTIWLAYTHSVYDGEDCEENTVEYIVGTITEQ